MSNNKIYLNNLAASVTEACLRERFAQYGEITDINLPLDRVSKQPKGYAFIGFSDASAVEKALVEDAQMFQDKELTVQIAIEKRSRKST